MEGGNGDGVGCGQLVPRSNLRNDNFQWRAEKCELLKRIAEIEGEMEELKQQRSHDAKANDKVAAIFAARTHRWRIHKNHLQTLLRQLPDLQRIPSPCSECATKEELILNLESKSSQLDHQLLRAFDRIQYFERECKIVFQEKEEIREKLVQLQKDAEEKEAIICCLITKSEEGEELHRELEAAEARKLNGDWIGLEKSLHTAHIKQRRLEELDAFERQMRAKDERMEAFRRKLLLMENVKDKLQKENESLHQSLRQAEAKTTSLEILLAEKNKAFGPCQDGLHKLEVAKNQAEKVSFEGVEDSETKYEENEHESVVAEEEMIRPQRHYEKLKQRLPTLFGKNSYAPKTSLNDSSFVWSCYDNALHTLSDTFDEERDRILPVKVNSQLKNLTEQDIQAFNSKCKINSLKGPHETRQLNIEKSGVLIFPKNEEIKRGVSDSESNNPDDLPVDKHVSGTLNLGTFVHNQTQGKDVTPLKFQPGLGVLGQSKNNRATALVNLESKATSLAYCSQSKGKTVSEDDYLTYIKWGRALENVHPGETAEGQISEQSTTCLQTVSGECFLARKDDDLSFGANHYLKHILQGKDSTRKEVGVTGISSEVDSLEQELLQLEKIAKTEVSTTSTYKDGKTTMNGNTQNGHENREGESNHGPLSAIRLLKKQVKRYQALIGKIDDLCKRMNDKDSVRSFNSSRLRERIAEQELFLMETFEHQHYLVTMGQKLMAIQSEIAQNSCAFYNDLILPSNFNMRQSIMVIKSHLKHIQRNLEIKLARIIGELEGTLARDGILHVMPVEWKKEHKPMLGKSEKGSCFSQVKL